MWIVFLGPASLLVWMIVSPKHHTPINSGFIRYENGIIIMTQPQLIIKYLFCYFESHLTDHYAGRS